MHMFFACGLKKNKLISRCVFVLKGTPRPQHGPAFVQAMDKRHVYLDKRDPLKALLSWCRVSRSSR
jgi:hypothetical protein